MPAPRGAILTDRDRALLAFAAIARYVSAEQVHRLFFDGSSKKQTYRRLAKLCQPGARPGEGACLRRLQYRRPDGTARRSGRSRRTVDPSPSARCRGWARRRRRTSARDSSSTRSS
jgi:hypothetical protein